MAVIEVMVAMIVLTTGLLGVAGMTTLAARRANKLAAQGTRDGIVLQELNRLASLPYDSIASRVGCTTQSTSILPHTRCVSVTDVTGGAGYKRVRIVITPTNTLTRPDTVYVNRARGAPTNPLTQ